MSKRSLMALSILLTTSAPPAMARAWVREHARTFAVLPQGSGGPEGLEVGPDGTVYVASFGWDAKGELPGPGQLFVYDASGRLLNQVTVQGSSSHLLGLRWHAGRHALLAIDFGAHEVLAVDPADGSATEFMTLPPADRASAGLNDLTFDSAGNVYVSDSFQGCIWRVGPGGGEAVKWFSDPLLTTTGIPPFGANGIRFNRAQTALFVANTGDDTIVKLAIPGGHPETTTPTQAEVFVSGINGADGLVVDEDDNLWVAANQEDEIVVVDPAGRVVAKLGDFEGVRNGVPRGLLFPASPRFVRNQLLVTNLALDLRLFGLPPAVDSPWTAEVARYTISALPARVPPQESSEEGEHGGGARQRDGTSR